MVISGFFFIFQNFVIALGLGKKKLSTFFGLRDEKIN